MCWQYLRMETVRASEELAQGQMASGRSPLDWKALRNESHEVRDPATQHNTVVKPHQSAGKTLHIWFHTRWEYKHTVQTVQNALPWKPFVLKVVVHSHWHRQFIGQGGLNDSQINESKKKWSRTHRLHVCFFPKQFTNLYPSSFTDFSFPTGLSSMKQRHQS